MLGLKLDHVSKRGHWDPPIHAGSYPPSNKVPVWNALLHPTTQKLYNATEQYKKNDRHLSRTASHIEQFEAS